MIGREAFDPPIGAHHVPQVQVLSRLAVVFQSAKTVLAPFAPAPVFGMKPVQGPQKFSSRAISPVVGAALMLVIVVALGVVVSGLVLGLADSSSTSPESRLAL